MWVGTFEELVKFQICYFQKMRSNKLQSLIERACTLSDCLNDEIEKNIGFCRFCAENGRFCDFQQTPSEERGSLISIRDSVDSTKNMLMHFQNLEAWQLKERDRALRCLEDRSQVLIKHERGYKGRALGNLKEINSCFGDEMREIREGSFVQKITRNILGCIRVLFRAHKWQQIVAGFRLRFILISVSLSSTIHHYLAKTQALNSQSKIPTVAGSTSKRETEFTPILSSSKNPLDVLMGRG